MTRRVATSYYENQEISGVVIQVISLCGDIKHYHMQTRCLCVMMRFICVREAHIFEAGETKRCAISLIKKRSVGRLGEAVENVSQQRLI